MPLCLDQLLSFIWRAFDDRIRLDCFKLLRNFVTVHKCHHPQKKWPQYCIVFLHAKSYWCYSFFITLQIANVSSLNLFHNTLVFTLAVYFIRLLKLSFYMGFLLHWAFKNLVFTWAVFFIRLFKNLVFTWAVFFFRLFKNLVFNGLPYLFIRLQCQWWGLYKFFFLF